MNTATNPMRSGVSWQKIFPKLTWSKTLGDPGELDQKQGRDRAWHIATENVMRDLTRVVSRLWTASLMVG